MPGDGPEPNFAPIGVGRVTYVALHTGHPARQEWREVGSVPATDARWATASRRYWTEMTLRPNRVEPGGPVYARLHMSVDPPEGDGWIRLSEGENTIVFPVVESATIWSLDDPTTMAAETTFSQVRFDVPRSLPGVQRWLKAEYTEPEADTPAGQRLRDMDERREAERRWAAERQREREEYQAAYQAAEDRARELLLSLLNDEQRASWQADRLLVVDGSAGGRYRITPGVSGNVAQLDTVTGEVRGTFCAHPVMRDRQGRRLPVSDVVVSQLLHLSTDEIGWLEVANVVSSQAPGRQNGWTVEYGGDGVIRYRLGELAIDERRCDTAFDGRHPRCEFRELADEPGAAGVDVRERALQARRAPGRTGPPLRPLGRR